MAINRLLAKEAFAKYTKDYISDDSRAALKIKHTYKVADLCHSLATEIGLCGHDVDVAWAIGLLHDVGRFEQLRRYGTFVDRNSVDHADLAVEILFGEGRIKDYSIEEEDYPVIKTAIANHNKYRVEKGLDKRTKAFCDIIRDADKLDIFRVNTENTREEVYEVSTDDFNTSVISPHIMESFFQEQVVDNRTKKAAIDGLVCHLSLLFELVYPQSVLIAQQAGYYAKIMDFVSQNPETNKQLSVIRHRVNSYFARRLEENSILDI